VKAKRKITSTNFSNEKNINKNCPLTYTVGIIGGRWKPIILWKISLGLKRFGELRTAIPLVSERMLTLQLRELEGDGIINRKVFAEVPPKVEYTLTNKGKSLTPILKKLWTWGEEHIE
jgi:DNA-binding HxlR family transcriptional regulator